MAKYSSKEYKASIMDTASSSIGSIQVEKLRDDNYHVWKHRIELILGLRDLDDCIEEGLYLRVIVGFAAHGRSQRRCPSCARAVVGGPRR